MKQGEAIFKLDKPEPEIYILRIKMRKSLLIVLLILLLTLTGASIVSLSRAQESEPIAIQVNSEEILLQPGENISQEVYALALDPLATSR